MFTDLGRFLTDATATAAGAAAGAAAGGGGLLVVEDEVNAVLKTLNDELVEMRGNDFEANAHIPGPYFGGGEEAAGLATAHTRAHGVVVDTLTALISDLEEFRESVREARRLLATTDAEAQAELEAILVRTEGLDLGANAHSEAQVRHVNDTPAPPPAEADA